MYHFQKQGKPYGQVANVDRSRGFESPKNRWWIGVNFINVKRARFSYECHFGSFSLLTYIRRKKLPKWCLYEKCVRIMLMKLTAARWKKPFSGTVKSVRPTVHCGHSNNTWHFFGLFQTHTHTPLPGSDVTFWFSLKLAFFNEKTGQN